MSADKLGAIDVGDGVALHDAHLVEPNWFDVGFAEREQVFQNRVVLGVAVVEGEGRLGLGNDLAHFLDIGDSPHDIDVVDEFGLVLVDHPP
jgi:hypothetical protein